MVKGAHGIKQVENHCNRKCGFRKRFDSIFHW